MFAHCARAHAVLPENGMDVRVLGQIGVYQARGQLQLMVERIEGTGAGGLWRAAMERLVAQLRSEGLLDEARKRPLPPHPDRVGIVTSAQGAALHDMHRALRRKAWWVTTVVSHCSVEGAAAAPEIARAVRRFTTGHCPVDVVIVARGGGSMESLWAFNTEPVARAVAECPVPTISAVGHETDHTVVDLVADVRAATPTAGAERAVPEGAEILTYLRDFPRGASVPLRRLLDGHQTGCRRSHEDLHRGMRRRMDLLRLVLDGADRHLEVRSPRRLLEGAAAELERLQGELHAAAGRRVGQLERELATAAEALDARSPLRLLSRGYALLVDDQSERAVRTPSDGDPGQRLRARLAEGELYVRAEGPVSAEAGQGGSHG